MTSQEPDGPEEEKKKTGQQCAAMGGAWIAIGVAIGVSMDNIGAGIAIGIGIGVPMAAAMSARGSGDR